MSNGITYAMFFFPPFLETLKCGNAFRVVDSYILTYIIIIVYNIKLNNYLTTDLIQDSHESEIQRKSVTRVGDDILCCKTLFNGESCPTRQYSMVTCVPPDVAR